ncbi:MAG: M1 family aminopeptidase [Planctomycetota bacterium]|nr:M1 family aminopeptidase [Planctomycetota bacterium]
MSTPTRTPSLTWGLAPAVPILLLGTLALGGCKNTAEPAPQPVAPVELAPVAVPHADAEHYRLELTLDPFGRSLAGTLDLSLSAADGPLSVVNLQLAGLRVFDVVDSTGRELAFFQKGNALNIVLAGLLAEGSGTDLTIRYGGSPQKGLWFVRERDGVPTQVFTQGECEDSSWWFPCIEDPSDRATSELIVTMPAGWNAVAAGERVDRTEDGSSVTEHWRMTFPHPAYLTTLVAGELSMVADEYDGIPLSYISAPEYADRLQATFGETPAVLDFLSNLTGIRYPYAKYSTAAVSGFPFGGMENISATTVTDTVMRDERGRLDGDAVGLIAHEAAHQWFGDLVTCGTWQHVWLNEGFATYMTQLYFEASRGNDEFRNRWYDSLQAYLDSDVGEARRPMTEGTFEDPIDLFFTGHAYAGGAVRLHYLRYVLGDGAFFDGVREYLARHAGGAVLTADFQAAMEASSGVDLDSYFTQWFEAEGYPELSTSWRYRNGAVELTVTQSQRAVGGTPEAFRFPVDVEVRTNKGSVTHRIEVDSTRATYELPCNERPSWVWFDEGGWLPARIDRDKTTTEWLAIAAGQDDVIARRMAVEGLGADLAGGLAGDQVDFARAELVNRMRQDSSSWVRAAAAKSLGMDKSPEARLRLMAAASSDANTHVRKAAFLALQNWGMDLELAGFARTQYREGYSWRTMGAAADLLVTSDPKGAFQWFVRALLDADSAHGVLRADLARSLARIDNVRVPSILIDLANDKSLETATRVAAVEALPKVAELDRNARTALIALLQTRDARLRRATVASLAQFDDATSRAALASHYKRSVVPRERRAIEATFGR